MIFCRGDVLHIASTKIISNQLIIVANYRIN